MTHQNRETLKFQGPHTGSRPRDLTRPGLSASGRPHAADGAQGRTGAAAATKPSTRTPVSVRSLRPLLCRVSLSTAPGAPRASGREMRAAPPHVGAADRANGSSAALVGKMPQS